MNYQEKVQAVGRLASWTGYDLEWLLTKEEDGRDFLWIWSGEYVMLEGTLDEVYDFLVEEMEALVAIDGLLEEAQEVQFGVVVLPNMPSATGVSFSWN